LGGSGGAPTSESGLITVAPGSVQRGVDLRKLHAGAQRALDPLRLSAQMELIRRGVERRTPILVTPMGAIVDGHHAARAAAVLGRTVDVTVVALEIATGEPVLDLPVRGEVRR
jgi:hypothetical protein